MAWVKRNLYFLIGAFIAVALMGAAGFFLYSNLKLNNEKREKLNETYTELKRLKEQKPHPGDGKRVDNIALAREQQDDLRKVIKQTTNYFQPIAPIPKTESGKVTVEEFTESLRQTITQLQRAAGAGSVTLPPQYNFSFEAQKNKVTFAPGSLEPLSVQLGEVRAICEILFRGKINALEAMRRERVSADDTGLSDYHDNKSVTNENGVLTRYEVAFRCFTPELATVISGFANSPHGIIVKGMAVEPSLSPGAMNPDMTGASPIQPQVFIPPPQAAAPFNPSAPIAAEGGKGGTPAVPLPVTRTPTYAQPSTTPKPQTAINEKLLRVTLALDVLKLRPQK